jgi:hypothetical protein
LLDILSFPKCASFSQTNCFAAIDALKLTRLTLALLNRQILNLWPRLASTLVPLFYTRDSERADVDWGLIRRPHSIARFRVHKQLNPNVATLRLFPGIIASTVNAFLAPPIEGVILETYGAGNAPSNRVDLFELLHDACRRGVVIVNTTQCKRGLVSDMYATGRALLEVGVVAGSDMVSFGHVKSAC